MLAQHPTTKRWDSQATVAETGPTETASSRRHQSAHYAETDGFCANNQPSGGLNRICTAPATSDSGSTQFTSTSGFSQPTCGHQRGTRKAAAAVPPKNTWPSVTTFKQAAQHSKTPTSLELYQNQLFCHTNVRFSLFRPLRYAYVVPNQKQTHGKKGMY